MREPVVRKCPICGNMTAGGECFSCGFEFPDEKEIAAPYDLDPSNDLFGEKGVEGLMPAMDTVSTAGAAGTVGAVSVPSGETPHMSGLSVSGQTVQLASVQPPPANAMPNIQVRPAANLAPAAQTRRPPKPAPPPAPVPASPPPPVTPQPAQYQQPPGLGTRIVRTVVDFVTAHWWQFLTTLLLPTTGVFFSSYYFIKFRQSNLVRNLLLGIVFLVLALFLRINNADILGLDRYLREILDDSYRRRRY